MFGDVVPRAGFEPTPLVFRDSVISITSRGHHLCHHSISRDWDVAQAVEHRPVMVWITRSILHSGCLCSLGYQWSTNKYIKGYDMFCHVCRRVHVKDPLVAYQKEYPMWRHQISSKEICHNGHMLDVQ